MADQLHGIITVASGKGGVGKTTSAMAVAGGLKKLGATPDAILDLDYGCSLTRSYGFEPSQSLSQQVLDGMLSFEAALNETDEGIALIPGTSGLAGVEKTRTTAWRDRLRELGRQKLIVIDTSDDIFSAPVAAAILAADVLLIPVPMTKKAYERTYPEIGGLLAAAGDGEPEQIWFGTMVDRRLALTNHMLKMVAEDGVELSVLIPRSVVADESDFGQVSLVAAQPKSKVAVAYHELAAVVFARLRRRLGLTAAREARVPVSR